MSSRQYFLGIGGDQSGPYLEQDILNRIRQGLIPPDALVWFEGLPDWQPIQSIEFLQGAFSEAGADFTATNIQGNETPTPSSGSDGFAPLAVDEGRATSGSRSKAAFDPAAAELDASTFASGSSMRTVFSEQEAAFGGTRGGGGGGKLILLGGLLLVCTLGAGAYLVSTGELTIPGFFEAPEKIVQAPVDRLPAQDDRSTKLRKAMSELLLQPDTAVPVLLEIAKENGKDAAGKEATDALLEYYKGQRNPSEAGRLLMRMGRPLEASQLFLSEPPSYREAEEAIFAAFKVSNDANKRDLLIQDIRLLLGQANNIPLAVERIRILEKDFKGTKHPFGYYLSPVDTRIADLFNRISFQFVQRLLAFIETEFPQMSLAKRPIIEIQKDKRGRYRVVGRYEGDVSLNQDKMDNIRILFWHTGEQWAVVETNLTPERSRWAVEEKERIKESALSGAEMLEYLENLFRTQFPKAALHEIVSTPSAPSKNMQ